MTTPTPDAITSAELFALRELAYKAEILKHQSAKVAADVEVAKLRLSLKYGLREADSVDINTGAITVAPVVEQVE